MGKRRNRAATTSFILYGNGLFSGAMNQATQAEFKTLGVFDQSKEENTDYLESEATTLPVWENVKHRAPFIQAFLKLKSQYQETEMNQFLHDFKESLKDVDESEMINWITNGDKKLDNLFKDKSQYPTKESEIIAMLVGEYEIYCKERAKGPNIKSYSGWVLSFFTTVFTGSYKIEAISAVQLDLLCHGLNGFSSRLHNPTSVLFPYKDALLENNSDTMKLLDQLLQFRQTKSDAPKHWAALFSTTDNNGVVEVKSLEESNTKRLGVVS